MLNPLLQRIAEQVVKGEQLSLDDEAVLCDLFRVISREGQAHRDALLTLRDRLNKVAPVRFSPVEIERRPPVDLTRPV